MKTIILIILLAAPTIYAQSFYHQMFGFIDVTSTNQSQHDMTVSVIHRTDDYGNPRDTDQRHISVRVPIKKGELKLESLRLLLEDPGPELSLSLAYSEEGLYASTEFLMALPLLKTGVLFATYENSEKHEGAGYCFKLIKYEEDINKPSEQAGPGYPPQGVGSPDP